MSDHMKLERGNVYRGVQGASPDELASALKTLLQDDNTTDWHIVTIALRDGFCGALVTGKPRETRGTISTSGR